MWSCIMVSTPGTVCLSTSHSGISVYQSFPGEYSTVRANRSGSSSGPVVLLTTAHSPTVQFYQCVCDDGWITFTCFIFTMELLAVAVIEKVYQNPAPQRPSKTSSKMFSLRNYKVGMLSFCILPLFYRCPSACQKNSIWKCT